MAVIERGRTSVCAAAGGASPTRGRRSFQGGSLFSAEAREDGMSKLPSGAVCGETRKKNVLRKQRHWEKIITAKKSKRKLEKERRKAQRTENPGESPQQSKRVLKAMTQERLLAAKHSGPRLCIDLSLTSRMTKKELSRLAGQIRRLYGSNKKAKKPFWICLTGFTTDSPLYAECLRMNDGFSNYLIQQKKTVLIYFLWKALCTSRLIRSMPLKMLIQIRFTSLVDLWMKAFKRISDHQGNYCFPTSWMLVLPEKYWIQKLTLQKAHENSIQTARLPIQEYMVKNANAKNYHSEILAINQVFDILSTYVETRNWPAALKTGVSLGKGYVIPDTVE
ncbi:tRNA methyltransferase 10 homolog B isoform X2 [Notamacropus eugenii]|uniref:tRNA methyltransferase 10 homolog B isoform X2 n=1 Tax=Notamacropus eugenii TaxID=9315 RepID=UPI003B6762F1